MPIEVRKTVASRNRAMINFFVAAFAGAWLLWDERMQPVSSVLWVAVGVLFLAWAAMILVNVLRPVVMRLDDGGIFMRGAFGSHKIAWADVVWVDFSLQRMVAVGYRRPSGRDTMGYVSRRLVDAAMLQQVQAVIMARRPDVPTKAPAMVAQGAAA